MSYQAIADVVACSQNVAQLRPPQISNITQDSLNGSQSLSFAQIMTSLQNDNALETAKSESPEQNQKTNSDEVCAEKPFEDKNKKTENVESKNDENGANANNVEKSEKDSKTVSGQKDEKKAEDAVEKSEKSAEKDSKLKKLSKKDFSKSKIDQFEKDDFEKQIENLKNAENLNNNAAVNSAKYAKKDEKIKETDDKDEDLSVSANISGTAENLEILDDKLKSYSKEHKEFDFSEDVKKSKKEFALDKDGKITVQDLRSEKINAADYGKKQNLKVGEPKLSGESTATFTMELNQKVEQNILSLNNQSAASDGSNFQAMLNNQIQSSAPEFVKAGNLILKDNNQGTINLILHPDDLGNVKIHLSLDGKNLSGHITVASKEALQVFKDNSETLREAFLKSGFDSANFDVSYNNNNSFSQNGGFASQNDGTDYIAKQVYGNSGNILSGELENILMNIEDISNYSVNIIA